MLSQIKVIVFFLFSLSINVSGQISSGFPHLSEPAGYNSEDSVFIFNRPLYGAQNSINLLANSPDALGGWTFNWAIYNPATQNYDPIASVDAITSQAGYRLIANRGLEADTFRVWVVFNDFAITITSKDEEGHLPDEIPFITCEVLQINSALDTTIKKFYYNPENGSIIPVNSIYRYNGWKKDKESGSTPMGRNVAYVSDPPWEDTWYTISVTDTRYGLERKDSVFYESIQPKAEVNYSYIPLKDKNYYPEEYSLYYNWDQEASENENLPAPAKIKIFNSESENSAKYLWDFGDRNPKSIKDTTTFTSNDTIIHEYFFPGAYTIKLYTWGDPPHNCIDSMILDDRILTLTDSYIGGTSSGSDSLIFPNVFTPNGDDFNTTFQNYISGNADESSISNDIFRPNDVSIYDFSIIIFNRFGKKVHEYKGNIRNWTGWDGKIMNSNRDASEGVYYYVVDLVIGFRVNEQKEIEVKKFRKKTQTGFVHLFRDIPK